MSEDLIQCDWCGMYYEDGMPGGKCVRCGYEVDMQRSMREVKVSEFGNLVDRGEMGEWNYPVDD